MHGVYWLLSYLVVGTLLPLLMLHPKLRQGIRRRFGLYPGPSPWPPSRGDGPRIWLHGASAGDLLALFPIITELRRRAPDATLVVSTMTNSGHAIAHKKLRDHVDGITFVPYDLPGATRRAVDAIRPDILVLEYTEIWPNLIEAAARRGVKVAMTNGRFSESLMGRYRLLYRLIGNPLQKMSLLLMREDVEAERAEALGAPPQIIRSTGNTKFDNLADGADEDVVARLEAVVGPRPGPLLVAGSTHEGEERGIVSAFAAMRASSPELRLLIAPRYTERGPRVASIVRAAGMKAVLRSGATADQAHDADVVVLDTIGELLAAYRLATLVFVGGSFVTRGGQNILEPAGQGRPVLFGPYMMNFRDSVEVLLGRGGIQVPNAEGLAEVGAGLLARPDEIAQLGAMAKNAVQKARGASARNARELIGLLS